MNKYLKAVMASLLVFILGASQVLAAESAIPDVAKSHWAYQQVVRCLDYGLMQLDEQGNFDPDSAVSHKDAVTFILTSINETIPDTEEEFYLLANERFGLAVPDEDSLSLPTTREELSYMISVAYGLTPEEDEVMFESMIDADAVSEQYRGYICAAIDAGVFYVDVDGIKPQGIVSRAVMAMVLSRIYMAKGHLEEVHSIFIWSLAVLALLFVIFKFGTKPSKKGKLKTGLIFVCLLIFSVAIRAVLGYFYYGHHGDMGCWTNWSNALYARGLNGIYNSTNIDYPPGYLYVLYLLGAIRSQANIGHILYKLPPMIFDCLWLVFAHSKAVKAFDNNRDVVVFDLLAALAPSLIINSAVWGQVDIIYIMFMILTINAMLRRKMKSSYFWYAIAILFKPQALVVAPVLLFGIWENVLTKKPLKEIVPNMLVGALAICSIVVLSIPFGLSDVFKQYGETLSSYPYFSVNAFNIYTMLGLNFNFLPAWFSSFNSVILAALVLVSVICFTKGNKNYYYLAGLISFMFFMLSAKIHERYCFPAPIFFLMAYLLEPKKRSHIICFLLTSFTYMVNCLSVFNCESTTLANFSWTLSGISALNLVILAYVIFAGFKQRRE